MDYLSQPLVKKWIILMIYKKYCFKNCPNKFEKYVQTTIMTI